MSDSDSSPPPMEFREKPSTDAKEKPSTTAQDDSSTSKTTTVEHASREASSVAQTEAQHVELDPSDIHLSVLAMQLARARMVLVDKGLQTPEQQAKQAEKQTQVVRRLSIVQDQLEQAKK